MRGARTKVLAYHKPRGVVTTHDDELGRETVYDRLRATLDASLAVEDWHAIGRLDQETTGLLLVTNDGALVHHATQPATKVPKTYRALVKGRLDEGTLQALRDGVELSGGLGRSAPCEVLLEVHQTATSWITLTLTEGKNRQIRRMLLAVGSQVIRLQRVRVGGIALDVDEDRWRLLGDDEVRHGLGFEPRALVTPPQPATRARRARSRRRP